MKYRVILQMDLSDSQRISLGNDHVFLWDTRDLIAASSGWIVLNQEDIGPAQSFIQLLERGILELTQSADSYQKYEVLHGLGTIRDTLRFYRELLEDCKEHPYTELYGQIIA